ncbi:MAG: hypothetical protein WA705_21465 [Candidatus Ozemobacteraceae bacterium]
MKSPLVRTCLGIVALLGPMIFSPSNSVEADQVRYIPPPNLSIEVSPKPGEKSSLTSSFSLTGTITPLVGAPRDLDVFFESSLDLAVTPASAKIAQLNAGKPAVFKIHVKPAVGKADEGGSFVRLRVVYHPDYAAVASFASDGKRYSDPGERLRLNELLERNAREKAKQTDAVRFFVR